MKKPSPSSSVREANRNFVLIVDDDLATRESIGRVLRTAHYEVLLAPDGQEAIGIFASHPIDLLIVDLNLPIRDGWDVFEELTRVDPFMPVIIITGMPNQFQSAAAVGAGALLEKPVDPAVLLATMKDLLGEPNEQRLRRITGYIENTRFAPGNAGQIASSRTAGRA